MHDTADSCEFQVQDLDVRVDETVAGDVKAIEPAVTRIMAAASEMPCARGHEFEIKTELREALANAVVHGCKGDPARTVGVSAGCDPSRGMIILVRIRERVSTRAASLPSPLQGERIYESHGRGIYLINRLMDEVRFGRRGTQIWMRKG